MADHQLARAAAARWQPKFHALLYGVLLVCAGMAAYLAGVLFGILRFRVTAEQILWYSGIPVVLGFALILFDLFVLLPWKRRQDDVIFRPPVNMDITVALTAYNDESSIGLAVNDFKSHPKVKRVIVVDNNSTDRTSEIAREADAIVILEERPGYGRCVWRALKEASNYRDTELTLLCEGDMTFRSYDIDKFLAYIPHSELVNGTRIVEQLRSFNTQITTFMYYGNFFTGKLLEAKHVGQGTFTDVGTTYKLCRNRCLRRLLTVLNPSINLEFNAHFLDTALAHGFSIVECPITFHKRVGVSKGGNVSNFRALKVGFRMIMGIVFNRWKQNS